MTSQNKFQKVFCKLPDILFSLMMMGILFICLFLSKMNYIRIYLGISEHNQLLLLFVGIPIPGTGAWTGTLAASILDMDFKSTIAAVMLGVLLAGIIMMVLSLVGVSIF